MPHCGLCWSSRGSRKNSTPWELDYVANRLSHLNSHIQALDSGCVVPCRTVAISWKFAWQPEKAEPLRGWPALTDGPQTASRPPWSSLRIYDWTATVQCCDLVKSLSTQTVAIVLLVPACIRETAWIIWRCILWTGDTADQDKWVLYEWISRCNWKSL